MIYPSLKEVKKITTNEDYKVVPISMELYSDIKTPIETLKILKGISTNVFILESVDSTNKMGRYTFLGYDLKLELTCYNHKLKITTGTTIEEEVKHPNEYIRKILKENKSPRISGMPTFTGGLVGYFSYDYIKYGEQSLNLNANDEEKFNDVDLMLFDKVIAFDNYRQKIILIVNIKVENLEVNYRKAEIELKAMADLIINGKKAEERPLKIKSDYRSYFSKEQYCNMVVKAKEYIKEGDIFQVVLSNKIEAEIEGSILDAYRVLRSTNPSPYMFYFYSNDIEISGASPETLVKLENNKLYTFPLAGTRKRGKDEEEDLELEKELLADEKELAEHNMLVDLGRNDIGKISEINSVKVDKYMSIEKFSHVMHIGSTVSGTLRSDKDALDAIDSILPAGTLSGAPKLRACEIINELEGNKRGIYGGAIGYIDFTGNLDMCISIRLAFAKNGKVFVRSGAGIVADSVPENEYEECINKSKAVINALNIAKGGIR
ncbi:MULTISPECIES: anthranilate synthase component I [Clostridium]|uniref:anthranilate synthase component I n=2 Tax=Clostridiaceae TaxID=31979 RepID=UPI0008214B21|nr:anthranilate synthase component I [Clostridium saudiense]MDU7454789.1 anthranilate synthase component I [Clostridium saudiense]SCJ92297.1 Anthranilate synthase component 1 [uncultured Clostridium sp.]